MQSNELSVKYVDEAPKKVYPRGVLPRRLSDRSKYLPHSGKREQARRLRQLDAGLLEMNGTEQYWEEQIADFWQSVSETSTDYAAVPQDGQS